MGLLEHLVLHLEQRDGLAAADDGHDEQDDDEQGHEHDAVDDVEAVFLRHGIALVLQSAVVEQGHDLGNVVVLRVVGDGVSQVVCFLPDGKCLAEVSRPLFYQRLHLLAAEMVGQAVGTRDGQRQVPLEIGKGNLEFLVEEVAALGRVAGTQLQEMLVVATKLGGVVQVEGNQTLHGQAASLGVRTG